MSDSKNPIVYFDISIGRSVVGRIEMTLRKDIVPKTVGKLNIKANHFILVPYSLFFELFLLWVIIIMLPYYICCI